MASTVASSTIASSIASSTIASTIATLASLATTPVAPTSTIRSMCAVQSVQR